VRAARTRVCALSIAGLDPGGGAGILADARAFAAAGAFACAVVAVDTVQSTDGLVRAWPREARAIVEQAEEVRRGQRLRAVKTGALGSAANVRAVAAWADAHRELPLVVDPVLAPTRTRAHPRSGAAKAKAQTSTRLADDDALAAMHEYLVPQATLVTANVAEAEKLTRQPVTNLAEAAAAGRTLVKFGMRAALVKGGHLTGAEAVDVLVIGAQVIELAAPRLAISQLHGGGCTLAALVAGHLATHHPGHGALADETIIAAVRWAKHVHHASIEDAIDVGGAARVLDPLGSRARG
jgi:hydroxymethylpyrimidine/phosphomethylpyrimidine kinase